MIASWLSGVLATFGLAFFWFIGSIPAGIALQLPPVVAGLIAWVSYVSGVLLIVLVGAPLRRRLARRFRVSLAPRPDSLLGRAWQRWGLIGLALLAPVTVGAQVGALIGLALGAAAGRLLAAMALGAAVWCAGITLAAALGLAALG